MVQHLASLAEKRLIISFAPKTLAYSILKRIGARPRCELPLHVKSIVGSHAYQRARALQQRRCSFPAARPLPLAPRALRCAVRRQTRQ